MILSLPRSIADNCTGSKWKYLVAIVLYSLTTAYMYGAAAFCIVAAVKQSGESLIYAEIVISLIATCEFFRLIFEILD